MIALLTLATAMAQTLDVNSATLQPVDRFLVEPQEWAGRGIEQHLVAPEGETFGVVTVIHRVQWPEDVDRWRLERDDVALMVGDERIAAVGKLDWGRFKNSGPQRTLTPTSSNAARTWQFVFPLASIPSDASLVVAEQQIPLELQPKVTELPSVAETVTITVGAIETVESLPGSVRTGSFQGPTVYRSRAGRIVAMDVSVVSSASNKEINGFFWQTSDLALSWDGGVVAPIGQLFSDKLSNNISHNPSVGEPPRSPSRVFFVVPDGVSAAKLEFHGVAMTDVTVGG